MLKRILLSGAAMMLASGMAAHADTTYNLDVQQNGKVGSSEGTVVVAQTASDELTVTVTLLPGFEFVDSKSGDSLVFNFLDSNGITIGNITSGFVQDTGTVMASPWGDFGYGVICSMTSTTDDCPNVGSTLQFTITDDIDAAINDADFTPNSGKNDTPFIYFASNVQSGGGVIAAGAAVPEPSSLMLLGTGALGLAGVVRRRFGR